MHRPPAVICRHLDPSQPLPKSLRALLPLLAPLEIPLSDLVDSTVAISTLAKNINSHHIQPVTQPGATSRSSLFPAPASSQLKRHLSGMSWMDSWSRPSANSKIPAPLYLMNQDVQYCQTCGRVMNSKKTSRKPKDSKDPRNHPDQSNQQQQQQEIKYCSAKCRSRKPGGRDREIESKIAALLDGTSGSGIEDTGAAQRVVKGDRRMIVTCDEIETACFGSRFDPEKVFGRRKNRRSRALDAGKEKEWRSVDMESSSSSDSSDDASDADGEDEELLLQQSDPHTINQAFASGDAIPFNISHMRPSQLDSETNFSAAGGERSKAERIDESPADLTKRLDGAKRAEEREMVRRAARRVVVFGVATDDGTAGKRRGGKSGARRGHRRGKKSLEEDGSDSEDGNANANAGGGNHATRKAEALMNGVVVEPSFAKGNWSIRWRE